MGRHSEYNEEIGNEICTVISCHPRGLKRLCAERPHWPDHTTIHDWRHRHPDFANRYTQAKINQIECLVDQCLDISDDSGFDARVNEQGNVVCDGEAINRARLRVDTRKWLACKLAPKLYGDRLQNEHGVSESVMQNIIDKL